MEEQTFEDLLLREAISQLEFDEPEREVEDSVYEKFRMLRIHASITYKFENGLVIKANPVTAEKFAVGVNNKRVSLADHKAFQNAEKKKKSQPLGTGSHLGILIESYDDSEHCYSAQLELVTVTYQHPEAIMNYSMLKRTTDLQEGDLVRIMERLRERYKVETSYKDGKVIRGGSRASEDPMPLPTLPEEKQNNVFTLELTPKMTVDDMVEAIGRVHRAGITFREGLYELQKERNIREEHEKGVEAGRQKSILGKF